MEVSLRLSEENSVTVKCDGQESHQFPLQTIHSRRFFGKMIEDPNESNHKITQWGSEIYKAFVKEGSLMEKELEHAKRVQLLCEHTSLQAIPWEIMHIENKFLVCKIPFLRVIPAEKRIRPPKKLEELHIVGVFSSPFSDAIQPLNIERDWIQLRQNIEPLPYQITLERCQPPTLSALRSSIAGKDNVVVHFSGHGGQDADSGYLVFEKNDGSEDIVYTRDLLSKVEKIPYLVDLNACVSAASGPSDLNNITCSLVNQGIPYALGMQMPIGDNIAKIFSNAFYSELARGILVEQAFMQARLELERSDYDKWITGIPVLYTSLEKPADGFDLPEGKPEIHNRQPAINLFQIPAVGDEFQGRNTELVKLGKMLTSPDRPHLITIQAGPGTGKTTLAKRAAEKFAHAFPGGVLAISIENTTDIESFCANLAGFFNIPIEGQPQKHRQAILNTLRYRDTLLILDNFETLLHAVDLGNREAKDLAQFIKNGIRDTQATLLLTSWEPTGWPKEKPFPISGLDEKYGAHLFSQWVSDPSRKKAITIDLARSLSRKVGGHPLSLRLLGGSFNTCAASLHDFCEQVDTYLAEAQDRYAHEDHRHRSLFACFDANLRFLDQETKELLFKIQIFTTSFTPDTAVDLFCASDDDGIAEGEKLTQEEAEERSQIANMLHKLQQKGWLTLSNIVTKEGSIELLRLPPAARIFLVKSKNISKPVYRKLAEKLGQYYYNFARYIYNEIDKGPLPAIIAKEIYPDLESCIEHLEQKHRGSYLGMLGWILWRLGYQKKGFSYLHNSLPISQEVGDRSSEATTLNNIGFVYYINGQLNKALEFYNQALPIKRSLGDRSGEATTLNNIGAVYRSSSQPKRALEFYDQALLIIHDIGDRSKEASTFVNIGAVYRFIGQHKKALEFYNQALLIMRKAGNRGAEATTLNNIGAVYRSIGQPKKALKFYNQALSIMRELNDHATEAATLNNIGLVYASIGQPQKALEFFNRALLFRREVGDRSGEATTLNNIGLAYDFISQSQEALEVFSHALCIMQEIDNLAGEAAVRNNISFLFESQGKLTEAIQSKYQAIEILIDNDLEFDAGGTSREKMLNEFLAIKKKLEEEKKDE